MSLPDLRSITWQSGDAADQAESLRTPQKAAARIVNLTAVVSGKGGVGKTNVVANLAVASAGLGARVLVVDGDMGLSNLDVLLGMSPTHNVVDVMLGRVALSEALMRGPKGIHVLAAGSGRHDLEVFERGGTARLLHMIEEAAVDFDLVLIDAGAGIGRVVTELAGAAARVLLVVVPEPTSFTDAYATCKTLWLENPGLVIEALVNCSENVKEGRDTHGHLEMVCTRFLKKHLPLRGVLRRDPRLRDAVIQQRAVVEQYPNSSIAGDFVALAQQLLHEPGVRNAHNGLPGNNQPERREGELTGKL